MATYSIDMMRRDLEAEKRLLVELTEALGVYRELCYDVSADPAIRGTYADTACKIGVCKGRISDLEALLIRSAR